MGKPPFLQLHNRKVGASRRGRKGENRTKKRDQRGADNRLSKKRIDLREDSSMLPSFVATREGKES